MAEPWEEQYQPPKSLIQVARESPFARNVVSSGVRFGTDIAHAATHPRETAEATLGLIGGAMEKLVPGEGELEKYPDALTQYVVDRYGSVDRFKQTMYEDPVGTMADLSAAAGLGSGLMKGAAMTARALPGVARAAPAIEATGRAAGVVSQLSDPLRLGFNAATLPLRPARPAERMYQSALKPPPGSHSSQEVREMVGTGLNERIPVSESGARKLRGLIQTLGDQVKARIAAGGNAGIEIDPESVATRIEQVKPIFEAQVNPEADLRAVSQSKAEFLRKFTTQAPFTKVLPSLEGPGYFPAGQGSTPVIRPIPIGEAQNVKVGTYRQLTDKAFGELKSAEIESQKNLARGLKEEISQALPEISSLNERQSKALGLEPVLERAIRRFSNHQLFGIGTPLAMTGVSAATGSWELGLAAGVIRAAIEHPWVKSRLAIMINEAQKAKPARFGPASMATATSRVDEYIHKLRELEKQAQAQNAPAIAAP